MTGLVAGIDASTHTLPMSRSLQGGEVRILHVVSREGMQNFDMVKVGDTITAVSSQAIAASVEKAQ